MSETDPRGVPAGGDSMSDRDNMPTANDGTAGSDALTGDASAATSDPLIGDNDGSPLPGDGETGGDGITGQQAGGDALTGDATATDDTDLDPDTDLDRANMNADMDAAPDDDMGVNI